MKSPGIFTITRTRPEISSTTKTFTRPKAKRLSTKPSKILCIFSFNSFDEFCEFCTYLNNSSFNKYISKLKNSSLTLFNEKYYLSFYNLKLSVADLKSFSYIISEFANRMHSELLLDRKLKEYGKVIISKDAVGTALKYFDK